MPHLPEIFLWLFVINLGVAFGAGLYETRIILPQWFHKSASGEWTVNGEAMRQTDTGRKFWGAVTTMPLTLIAIVNLVFAWQATGAIHDWWLAAAAIVFVERVSTFSFFIPTAIKLMRVEAVPSPGLSSLVFLWIRMNYVRNLLTLLGWLGALRALQLLG